ncbi:hypothetical protein [Hahella sp. HN01]|uniref:DUF7352 domain-containing protein n=1 Tax=Hahella sp. HN01 TaxID=2847262 RepID=UPI001C1F1948|nr:hypothetical protein [Hahella sp. HN01]MBU6955904.1 hypothetical protein [Hahella sp. HN01]
MKTIHKYRLQSGAAINTLNLRQGYRIVRSEYLLTEKAVFIWVEEPLSVSVPCITAEFVVVLTGDPVPRSYIYRDTALDPFGPEAFHVYEIPEGELENKSPEKADRLQAA